MLLPQPPQNIFLPPSVSPMRRPDALLQFARNSTLRARQGQSGSASQVCLWRGHSVKVRDSDCHNTMSLSCPQCASQMPDTAAFCPGCGHPMLPESRARGRVGILSENVAGALAYVSFIPAVVFLFLDPYNKNRFVRFHSFQCIFLWITGLLIAVALRFVGLILYIIPVLGHLLVWLIEMVVVLGAVVIWLVLMVKALQGEAFKLPVIGDLAERQAGSF